MAESVSEIRSALEDLNLRRMKLEERLQKALDDEPITRIELKRELHNVRDWIEALRDELRRASARPLPDPGMFYFGSGLTACALDFAPDGTPPPASKARQILKEKVKGDIRILGRDYVESDNKTAGCGTVSLNEATGEVTRTAPESDYYKISEKKMADPDPCKCLRCTYTPPPKEPGVPKARIVSEWNVSTIEHDAKPAETVAPVKVVEVAPEPIVVAKIDDTPVTVVKVGGGGDEPVAPAPAAAASEPVPNPEEPVSYCGRLYRICWNTRRLYDQRVPGRWVAFPEDFVLPAVPAKRYTGLTFRPSAVLRGTYWNTPGAVHPWKTDNGAFVTPLPLVDFLYADGSWTRMPECRLLVLEMKGTTITLLASDASPATYDIATGSWDRVPRSFLYA